MKIWIFSQRKLWIRILLILFAFFFLLLCTYSPSIQVSSNDDINFLNKVNTLSKGKEKIAYLTFDDGPNPFITPKVLDILKEENVKASFFVIGKLVEAHPDIVKRAYDEGHYIANHSYSHNNSTLYKNFAIEITKTDTAIGKAIGKENYCCHIFRFPNGFMSPIYQKEKKEAVLQLSRMNYTYIDWNCLNNDSVKKYTSSQLLQNLKNSSKNKDTLIILMHDTKDVSNSSLVLQDSILYLKSQGYTFQNFYNLIP